MTGMFFGLSPDQQEFQQALRGFFRSSSTSQDVRRLIADQRGYDETLWRRMADELAVQGLDIPEQYGGSGASFIELAIALEETGYALAGGPLFASSVLAASCLRQSGDTWAMGKYLPGIASGQTVATFAVADDNGAWDPAACTGVRARQNGHDYVLTGTRSYVPDAHLAHLILVTAQAEDGPAIFAVDRAAPGLRQTRLPLLDQTRRMSRLEFTAVPGSLVGAPGAAEPVITRTLLTAAVALGAEQVGGIRRCLDMAVEYVKIRVQFNRPIGGFQAIKHMCADMYTLMETARSAVLYAAWCVANDTSDLAAVAHLTKAYCSDAFYRVAADNIQVHGGIGFTWEHDCHLLFRRATASLQYLGSPQFHRELLARAINL
jgi:alkylation response protein AidB-like acyl-CoA dehydrogenase